MTQIDLFDNLEPIDKQTIVKSYETVIDPVLAKKFLKYNTNNRDIRPTHVRELSLRMKNSEWRLIPSGIILDKETNRLIDGQHRLLAIIDSGVSVPMKIDIVSDSEIFKVLDQNARRSASDVFSKPKHVTETVSYCCRTMMNSRSAVPNSFLEPVLNSKIGELAEELYDFSPTRRKLFSSAPVKAAAVISMFSGSDKQYVLESYDSMISYKTQAPTAMSSAVSSFYDQIHTTGTIDPDKRNLVFAKATKAFNSRGRNVKQLRISQNEINDIINKYGRYLKEKLTSDGSIDSNWGKF